MARWGRPWPLRSAAGLAFPWRVPEAASVPPLSWHPALLQSDEPDLLPEELDAESEPTVEAPVIPLLIFEPHLGEGCLPWFWFCATALCSARRLF